MRTLIVFTICLASVLAQDQDDRCPASEDASDPTLFGHATDCTKFFKCLSGRAYEINCPDGQQWNRERSYCDTIENAKCDLENGGQMSYQSLNRPNFPHQQQPIQRPNFPQQPNQRPNFPQQINQRPNFPQQQPIPRPLPMPIPRPQPIAPPQQRPNFPHQPIAPPQRPSFPQPIAPPQRPNVPQTPVFEHPDFIRCPTTDAPGSRIVYFPYHLNCDMVR